MDVRKIKHLRTSSCASHRSDSAYIVFTIPNKNWWNYEGSKRDPFDNAKSQKILTLACAPIVCSANSCKCKDRFMSCEVESGKIERAMLLESNALFGLQSLEIVCQMLAKCMINRRLGPDRSALNKDCRYNSHDHPVKTGERQTSTRRVHFCTKYIVLPAPVLDPKSVLSLP